MTLPYPENPGATHFDGCWRTQGHHNCAVGVAERFARAWQQYEASLETWHHAVQHGEYPSSAAAAKTNIDTSFAECRRLAHLLVDE